MSSLQTTYHNICAANGVKSLHLESHEVLEKMKEIESHPQVKRSGSICIWSELCVGILELYGLVIGHCISVLERFVTYFFAQDKLNYARMIPIYLAEIPQLDKT